MPLEKVLNHLLYIVVIRVTDEGSIYNPISCNLIGITFASHCNAVQYFFKVSMLKIQCTKRAYGPYHNSIWFLKGVTILQEVSVYKKNPQNIEMQLLYS